MKRRGITRFVALVTMVSMLGSGFSVQAEPEDAASDSTATNQTGANNTTVTSNEGASTEATSDGYVNEMLTTRYSAVSKKYTYSKYTGETVEIPANTAWDTTSQGTLINESNGYQNPVVQLENEEEGKFLVNVPQDGIYNLGIEYLNSDESSILPSQMSMTVNGEVPFYEANTLLFESNWEDEAEKANDRYGNQIVSIPNKVMKFTKKYVMDSSYRYSTPLALELKAGENIIAFTVIEGPVQIGKLTLEMPEIEIPAYQSVSKNELAVSDPVILSYEAEEPSLRNDSSIRPTCEYDPDLSPYKLSKKTLNMIDGDSFKEAGQFLEYTITVEKEGYYYLGFNYRQSDKVDFPVFMDISVDGAIPNQQMQSYPFQYAKSFTNMTLKDSQSKDKIALKLTPGTHTVRLTISNDNLKEALEIVDEVMDGVNDLALSITKVAGTNQDKYRTIDLEKYIPGVQKQLYGYVDELQATYDQLTAYAGVSDSGTLSSIKMSITLLKSLAKEPNKIPYRINELSQSTSSVNQYLANFITDANNDKIALDRIYVYQEGKSLPKKHNIFVRIWESIKRFFASFGAQSYSVDNVDKKHLQVWVARSRQYLEILQQLIDEDFTPKTGIEVDLCIMPDAQKLILSNAAGEAPDVGQAIDYAMPFELAIRGAIKDLTEFPDYQDTLSLTSPGLLIPGTISSVEKDGTIDNSIYAMPETFYFWLLYYRTDIMEKLGLEVPQTLDDVKALIPDLKNRGLDFYYPTAGTVGTRTFAMTTPILYQYGASLYGEYCGDTTLGSEEAYQGFETLTDLFNIYDISKDTPSIYQHFRNGDMPIAVADYFMYNMLTNAAPEIENSWEVALVPGVDTGNKDAEGNPIINRQTAGGAQSTVIFKEGKNADPIVLTSGGTMSREDASWEYLKWYMSTDIQTQFGTILQTTYGKEFIWNSANMEAMEKLPWDSKNKKVILQQMANIEESPRLPGTYMLERELSNAYVEVVVSGSDMRTSLDAAIKRMDRETERKLEEFGYTEETGRSLRVPTVDLINSILQK